jgi:hypothetical protein
MRATISVRNRSSPPRKLQAAAQRAEGPLRHPEAILPPFTSRVPSRFEGPARCAVIVRPDGLFAAAPLVLRCAPDCRRALRGSVQLGRRRSSCRTGLVVCRRFELLGSAGRHELPENFFVTLVRPDGFEPPTTWFEVTRVPYYSVRLTTLEYAFSMA